MILSLISQKGGIGKSTVAVNLAAMFAAEGYKVLIIDADDQNSSLKWLEDRPKEELKIVGTSLPHHYLRKQAKELAADHQITIIDCKGAISDAGKAALVVSDFFLIPLICSSFDLASTEDFIDKVVDEVAAFKEIRGAIFINKWDNTILARRIVEYVEADIKIQLLKTKLSPRVTYKEAVQKGLSVTEWAPDSKASKEMQGLFAELTSILGLGGQKNVNEGLSNNPKKTKRTSTTGTRLKQEQRTTRG